MRQAGGIGQGTKLNLKDSGRRAEDQPLALRVAALNKAGLERDLGYHSSGDGVRFEPRGPGRVLGSYGSTYAPCRHLRGAGVPRS